MGGGGGVSLKDTGGVAGADGGSATFGAGGGVPRCPRFARGGAFVSRHAWAASTEVVGMPFLTSRETTDLSMRKALLNSVIPTACATMSNYATLRKATSDWQTAWVESVGRVPMPTPSNERADALGLLLERREEFERAVEPVGVPPGDLGVHLPLPHFKLHA